MPFTDSVELRSAPWGSGSIRYADSGDPRSGPAETVVLLNGLSDAYVRSYWAFFPMLALRYRVIAFDFVTDEGEPGIDMFCDQAHSVIRAASPDKPAHLVGHSYGAAIAATCAVRHPDVVRSLTLVAGWAKTDNYQRLGNDIEDGLAASQDHAGDGYGVLRHYSPAFINGRSEAELSTLRRSIRDRTVDPLNSSLFSAVNIESELSDIRAPTLVVGCTSDLVAPVRHSKLLFAGIDDCRLVQIHSGHFVMLERPAELFKVVDEFIQAPNATPPGHVYDTTRA